VSGPGATTGFLDVTDLSVRYRSAGTAIAGVSIAMAEGEVVAVLGPNGAGKTTLLRAIAGFAPDEPGSVSGGSVQFRGRSMARVPAYRRARLGVVLVPERDKVFSGLTVHENLELACPRGTSVSDAVAEVVEMFPALGRRIRTPGGLLSGGERQMLAMARAFMRAPTLLLLDETSLGLAPIIAEEVMHKIRTVVRDKRISVLLVEQNFGLAQMVADRYYVLSGGRITRQGSFSDRNSLDDLSTSYFGGQTT
jgi:branched-chain amino acid transport system ATP-binding protein